jgi:hypothetical protein
MRYLETEDCTDFGPPSKHWLERILPSGNPDFADRLQDIKRWYVEVNDSGEAVRELGLNANRMPVLAAPFRGNFGFWTDANPPFPIERARPIPAETFESAWATIMRQFQVDGLRPDDA